MIDKEKFDELQAKQDILRQERNFYSSKQQEIQKLIDSLEIQKYDVNRLIGKLLLIDKRSGSTYSQYKYMIVDRIERLYSGPKFYGKLIEICFSNDLKIGNSLYMCERSEWSGIKWENVDELDDNITPESLKISINRLLNEFDYGEEINKLKTKHGQ